MNEELSKALIRLLEIEPSDEYANDGDGHIDVWISWELQEIYDVIRKNIHPNE